MQDIILLAFKKRPVIDQIREGKPSLLPAGSFGCVNITPDLPGLSVDAEGGEDIYR
ncbi:hypothetical protein D3C73_1559910 [compost metagenome]